MKNRFLLFSILGLLFMFSCRPESFDIDMSIIKDSYEIQIEEPSGLAYSKDKLSLYTVSDQGKIYQISLTGDVLRELPFKGDDFEGITVDSETSEICICEEREGNLIKLDSIGVFQSTYDILQTPGNSGLEGLTYNHSDEVYYMLKEKMQGTLIKYDVKSNSVTQLVLGFAHDYSGLFYHHISNTIWIVSDESRTLTRCTTEGIALKIYDLPISGVEGIVVNDDETEAYVVSDPNNKLYKIDLTM
ncbi:MAG: hypothetical protein HOK35_12410 [Cytophagia bacterium]|nr:hypothetical protein [Cytophagia bacterium]